MIESADALRRLYGKAIPDGRTGEALEISCIPGLESTDDAGEPLPAAIARDGEALTGEGCAQPFPLLLKLPQRLLWGKDPGDNILLIFSYLKMAGRFLALMLWALFFDYGRILTIARNEKRSRRLLRPLLIFVWRHFGRLLLLSLILAVVGRRFYGRAAHESDDKTNDRLARQVGRVAVVDTAIVGGTGHIRLDDTVWRAEGPELPAGATVRIVGSRDGRFIVEAA